MSNLTPTEALAQAIKASKLLLNELASFKDFEQEALDKTNQLAELRDQLINQVFSHSWNENEVSQQQNSFAELETLNKQLTELAATLRYDLHQLRVDNQQGRKALSAYGTAKGQFHR